jgi:MFS family permease
LRRDPYLLPVLLGSTAFVFLNFGLPVQARLLGAEPTTIGGMYTAFTVTMLIVRPLVGIALDRFGRRAFFACAFVFYSVAMWAFGRADSVADFYVARFLQGMGASLMWVSVRTIVADLHVATERGRAMGRVQANSVRGGMLGAFYGFTLIGFYPQARAWQLAFAGYALAALAGFVCALWRQGETAVVRAEPTARLVWSADIVRLLIIVMLSGFASALIEPVYLLYLQDRFGLGFLMLAVAFLPAGLVHATLPGIAGGWSDRFGRAPALAAGLALAAVVSLVLPWLTAIGAVAACYALAAAGWAIANPAGDALLGDLAPEAARGRAFGMRELAAMTGAALGPLAGGAIYQYWRPELVFVLNGVLLITAATLAWVWFRTGPAATMTPRI